MYAELYDVTDRKAGYMSQNPDVLADLSENIAYMVFPGSMLVNIDLLRS